MWIQLSIPVPNRYYQNKNPVLPCYLFHISIKWNSKCSVNVFLIFWKDSERFSMFSYVVSIILMWPIFYIYGECQKYFLLLFFSSEIQNIFQWNETFWCEVSSFSEIRGHLLQISILQIRSWLSFFWIVAVTLWASCCFCKFVFKQSDAVLLWKNLATFQFTQHSICSRIMIPDLDQSLFHDNLITW